jgi:hypothetical protein
VVVEADDCDAAVTFHRDVLRMPELSAFAEGGDDRVAILDAGRATLEIASPQHKRVIDRVDAQGRPGPRIRIALEVDDADGQTRRLVEAGADLVAEPVMTPWRSVSSRLGAPAGLTVTLFQETEDEATRLTREGFTGDAGPRLLTASGLLQVPLQCAQLSNTPQQRSLRARWSSSTSARTASGSWSRCHRHSCRPAASSSPGGAAARAALIA